MLYRYYHHIRRRVRQSNMHIGRQNTCISQGQMQTGIFCLTMRILHCYCSITYLKLKSTSRCLSRWPLACVAAGESICQGFWVVGSGHHAVRGITSPMARVKAVRVGKGKGYNQARAANAISSHQATRDFGWWIVKQTVSWYNVAITSHYARW